jgi:hypothetical protein
MKKHYVRGRSFYQPHPVRGAFMLKVGAIVGSTRPNRFADKQIPKYRRHHRPIDLPSRLTAPVHRIRLKGICATDSVSFEEPAVSTVSSGPTGCSILAIPPAGTSLTPERSVLQLINRHAFQFANLHSHEPEFAVHVGFKPQALRTHIACASPGFRGPVAIVRDAYAIFRRPWNGAHPDAGTGGLGRQPEANSRIFNERWGAFPLKAKLETSHA